jgi:hypothetical protein
VQLGIESREVDVPEELGEPVADGRGELAHRPDKGTPSGGARPVGQRVG